MQGVLRQEVRWRGWARTPRVRIHQARTPPGVIKRRVPGRDGARTPQVMTHPGFFDG